MKAIYIVTVLAGAVLLLAGCATEWKEKNDSDEFFGRKRGPGIGPFAF